jgi:hypothetical protein
MLPAIWNRFVRKQLHPLAYRVLKGGVCGAFRKAVRKSECLPHDARLPVLVEERGCEWKDLRESLYWGFFTKICRHIPVFVTRTKITDSPHDSL